MLGNKNTKIRNRTMKQLLTQNAPEDLSYVITSILDKVTAMEAQLETRAQSMSDVTKEAHRSLKDSTAIITSAAQGASVSKNELRSVCGKVKSVINTLEEAIQG